MPAIVGSLILGLIVGLASHPLPEVRKHMQGRGWQAYPGFLVLMFITGTLMMIEIAWGNLPMAIGNGCVLLFDIWQVNLMLGRTQKAIDRKLAMESVMYERALEREGVW